MEHSTILTKREGFRLSAGVLFCGLWLLLFLLYLPAAKAGFVADFTGWLDEVRHHSFQDFINRTDFQAKSLYQFTQLATYVCYKLFGINAWAWHILFITLHALNATLLYVVCRNLLDDAGARNSAVTAAAGAVLFCISAYVSEVIVWEPAYHFLQGLLFILLVLVCVQKFVQTGKPVYPWLAGFVYILSVFSLEIFYITPWLVLSLAFFYHLNNSGRNVLKTVPLYFFLPMMAVFIVRMWAYYSFYGDWVSRVGSATIDTMQLHDFGKPAKYIFNLLFLGRFFADNQRYAVYHFLDSYLGIGIFGSISAIVLGYAALRFRSMSPNGKVASLLFGWLLITLVLLIPLWFQSDLLVIYDRYYYFAGAFFYALVAVCMGFITITYLRLGLLAAFALINLRFAIQVSRYWGKSARVVNGLLQHIPDDRSKTMILLNIPQSMQGIAMIGAEKNSEYKLMHDLLIPQKPLTNTVYDVLAYNMNTPNDGAHVNVINDSMIKVTLNQFGTWWWFETRGGYSYWTEDYKLNLVDPGHWYELTLRKPASQYILLYSVGDQWKVVDMSKRVGDQN